MITENASRNAVIILLSIAWAAGMVGVVSMLVDASGVDHLAAGIALAAIYTAMPFGLTPVFKTLWPKP